YRIVSTLLEFDPDDSSLHQDTSGVLQAVRSLRPHLGVLSRLVFGNVFGPLTATAFREALQRDQFGTALLVGEINRNPKLVQALLQERAIGVDAARVSVMNYPGVVAGLLASMRKPRNLAIFRRLTFPDSLGWDRIRQLMMEDPATLKREMDLKDSTEG